MQYSLPSLCWCRSGIRFLILLPQYQGAAEVVEKVELRKMHSEFPHMPHLFGMSIRQLKDSRATMDWTRMKLCGNTLQKFGSLKYITFQDQMFFENVRFL